MRDYNIPYRAFNQSQRQIPVVGRKKPGNFYLHELLDPATVPARGYPTKESGQSAVSKQHLNFLLPYGITDHTPGTGAGSYTWKAGRAALYSLASLSYPVRWLASMSPGVPDFTGQLKKNGHRGFVSEALPIGFNMLDVPEIPTDENITLVATGSPTYNVVMEMFHQASTMPDLPHWFHRGIAQDGTEYFGMPLSAAANPTTSGSFKVNVDVASASPTGGGAVILEARLVQPAGFGLWVPLIRADGVAASNNLPGQYYVNLDMTTFDCRVPPGVGVQLHLTTVPGVIWSINNISFSVKSNVANPIIAWRGMQVRDYEALHANYTSSRVVASCTLVSPRISDYFSTGSIACAYVAGGLNPGMTNLCEYSTVAAMPQWSRNWGVKYGAYTIWMPSDSKDMVFREHEEGMEQYPYTAYTMNFAGVPLVVSGAAAQYVPENAFVVDFWIHYEGKTTSTIITTRPFNSKFEEVAEAQLVLGDGVFSPVMENPLHMQEIGKTLRKYLAIGLGGVQKAHSWYEENRGWINPVMSSLALFL
jgi:hypothetical protein